jgi:hypothetical protein
VASIDRVVAKLDSVSPAKREFAFAPIAKSPHLQWKRVSDPVYLVAKIWFTGRRVLADELIIADERPELERLRRVLIEGSGTLDACRSASELAAALAVALAGSGLEDLRRDVASLSAQSARAWLVLNAVHHSPPPVRARLWTATVAGAVTSLAVTADGSTVMAGTSGGLVKVVFRNGTTQVLRVSNHPVVELHFLEGTPFGWCRDRQRAAAILRVQRPVSVMHFGTGSSVSQDGWTFRLTSKAVTARAPDGRKLAERQRGFQVKMHESAPLTGAAVPRDTRLKLESRALVLQEKGTARCVLRTVQYSHLAAVGGDCRTVARQLDAPFVVRGHRFPHRLVFHEAPLTAPSSEIEVFDTAQLLAARTVTGNPLLESVAETVRSDGPYVALTDGTVFRVDGSNLVRAGAAELNGRSYAISAVVVRGRQALLLSSHVVLSLDLVTGRCAGEMRAAARVQDAAFLDDRHYLCTIGSGVESERFARRVALVELGPNRPFVWQDTDYEQPGWTHGDPVRLCVSPLRLRAAVFTDLHAFIGYDLLLREKAWLQKVESYMTALVALDEDRVVTGHHDGSVAVWDVRTGENRARVALHQSSVAGVAVVGGLIVSTGTMGSVRISTASLEPLGGLQLPGELSTPVALSDRRLLIGSGPELRVFELAGEQMPPST